MKNFCWHRWTRWVYNDESCNIIKTSYRDTHLVRYKDCVKCGKIKMEIIKK